MNRQEFHVILPLLFFTLLLGIYPNFVLESIHFGVSSIIYHYPLQRGLSIAGYYTVFALQNHEFESHRLHSTIL